jgi:hypothetical protein
LILIFPGIAEDQDQKIAAFGSSYGGSQGAHKKKATYSGRLFH